MALRVVHADFRHELASMFVFDILRDRLEFHDLGDLRNRSDHRFRDPVFRDVANETAVYLENIDGEILQVGK